MHFIDDRQDTNPVNTTSASPAHVSNGPRELKSVQKMTEVSFTKIGGGGDHAFGDAFSVKLSD